LYPVREIFGRDPSLAGAQALHVAMRRHPIEDADSSI
jgi:hypothetical protein